MRPLLQAILKNNDAREGIKKGIDKVADAAAITLGPDGRTVLIGRGEHPPAITKDGYTVVNSINLPDRVENVGAQLMRGIALKTVRDSGDGTTSVTILTQCIVNEGMKMITAGANPVMLKSGIEKAVKKCVEYLKAISKDVNNNIDTLRNVATISANNDKEIGGLIADAFSRIGKDGDVGVKESLNSETTVDIVMGTRFSSGYLSPLFSNNIEKMICELDNPYILVTDTVINNPHKGIIRIADIVKSAGRSLLVIAEDVQNESLQFLTINKLKGSFQSVAVRSAWSATRRADEFEDIATLTGATMVSSSKGLKLENVEIKHLGSADKVVVTKEDTTIIGGHGKPESIEARASNIRLSIQECKEDNKRSVLTERLAKITGGIAVIFVGANTPVELNEKKDRVDDAIRATKSAIEEGILPGGGSALLSCINVLSREKCNHFGVESIDWSSLNEDEIVGVNIVAKACEIQLRQICVNCGVTADSVIEKVKNEQGCERLPIQFNEGYNAKTHKYEDLIASGVIDPTKVVRCALENAASAAAMVLLSGAVLVDEITH